MDIEAGKVATTVRIALEVQLIVRVGLCCHPVDDLQVVFVGASFQSRLRVRGLIREGI
jgi:hypothetical protein